MSKSIWFLFVFLGLGALNHLHANTLVCTKLGFFRMFLQENLTLTGNCDDPDKKMMITAGPNGLVLNKLGNNNPIPMRLDSDVKSSGSGITQFGKAGHTGTFEIMDGSHIKFFLQNSDGGRCDAIAAGGSRCLYNVVSATCASNLLPDDRVCMPCSSPCKDYGNSTVEVWVQGTPTVKCTVKLTRVDSRCGTCNGKGIIPAK